MISRNHACCYDCESAELLQYKEADPVIARCKRTGQRDVAKSFVCREFKLKRGVVRVKRLYERD